MFTAFLLKNCKRGQNTEFTLLLYFFIVCQCFACYLILKVLNNKLCLFSNRYCGRYFFENIQKVIKDIV
jgi:hypothetical protein